MVKPHVALCSLALVALASVSVTNGAEIRLISCLFPDCAGTDDLAPEPIVARKRERPVDRDVVAIRAKYMKKSPGLLGKISDAVHKVPEREMAEADKHGRKMSSEIKSIQIQYKFHIGVGDNDVFPYEENFAKFKRGAERFKDMSSKEPRAEQLNKVVDLYVAMDPSKCDPESIENMKTLVRLADLDWFMENNRWTRTPPAYHIQRHIAMNAYEQSQRCATENMD